VVVEREQFVVDSFGELVAAVGDHGPFLAFQPKAIPRNLPLDGETIYALSLADAALGRLAGTGRLLRDPHVFVRPYMVREAVASSRIEGTEASLSDVFQVAAGAEPPAGSEVLEVVNYIRALEHGMRLLETLPISRRLVREVHGVLLEGVRGRDKRPGEFRRDPVWIGSTTDNPATAVFVPPLADPMDAALDDWERYANEDLRVPVLIQSALLHYQFETIHPFLDGNGRLGRLLIVLHLLQTQRLSAPLLYISSFLERSRREYYDRLQAVRERGEIQEWIQFFLTAVARQAEDAVARSERLFDLRESWRGALSDSRGRAVAVVDLLFENPVITALRVERQLDLTNQGALNIVRHLERRGWLKKLGNFGRGGRQYWIAGEIVEILS
jgi:Fic family protein